MARIIAKGYLNRKPFLGRSSPEFADYPKFDDYQEIIVEGDQYVNKYICNHYPFEMFARTCIKNGVGRIGNWYPEPNSMLQAYSFLLMIFGKDAVKVEGKIDFTNDDYDPDAIY